MLCCFVWPLCLGTELVQLLCASWLLLPAITWAWNCSIKKQYECKGGWGKVKNVRVGGAHCACHIHTHPLYLPSAGTSKISPFSGGRSVWKIKEDLPCASSGLNSTNLLLAGRKTGKEVEQQKQLSTPDLDEDPQLGEGDHQPPAAGPNDRPPGAPQSACCHLCRISKADSISNTHRLATIYDQWTVFNL